MAMAWIWTGMVALSVFYGLLNGTTALAVCHEDPVAPARVVNDFAKKLEDHFEIKGGFMDGKAMPLEEVLALAAIPPLPVLRARSWALCWRRFPDWPV